MGFTTTSKGLIKPNNDNSTPADVSQLNTNFDRIDSYGMGPFVCTSTTRSTGADLWDGLIIKETDTGLIRMYDAATADWPCIAGEASASYDGTANTSTGNNALWGAGVWNLNGAKSKNPTAFWHQSGESFIIDKNGTYSITLAASFASTIGAYRCFTEIERGGNTLARGNVAPNVGETNATANFVGHFNATDGIQLVTYQNSGGNLVRAAFTVDIARIS